SVCTSRGLGAGRGQGRTRYAPDTGALTPQLTRTHTATRPHIHPDSRTPTPRLAEDPSEQGLALRVVARHRVPLAPLDQLGLLLDARLPLGLPELVRELRAPGAEPAAARRVGRAGHVADHRDPLA